MHSRAKYSLLFILIGCLLLGSMTVTPQNHDVSLDIFPELPQHMISGIGDNTEDFVETVSDLHDPTPDVGTHAGGGFVEMQDKDGTYDTLTEADAGGGGAITVENSYTSSGKKATSTTIANVVVPTSTGRAIYVMAACGTKNSEDAKFISGIVFQAVGGDQAFSMLGEAQNVEATSSIWYLLDPDQETADVVITYDDNNANWEGWTIALEVLSGVDTAGTPHDTWETPSEGTSTSATHAVATATGDLVYGIASVDGAVVLTENGDGIEIFGTAGGTNMDGSAIKFTADDSSSALSCSISASAPWVFAGVSINPSSSSNYDLDLEVGWTVDTDFDETNEELCIFGGTQGSEALRVDYWTGSWTNVITDLAAGWNNVSVSITGVAFEIRFTDTTGDAVEADTWEVEGVLLHTWTPSYTPVNDQAPTLDNPTDTNRMYAQYVEYQVTAYVSDQNGYADIDYLEFALWDNTRTTEYFRFRYDEDTNTFTEEYDSGTVVSLNTGSSSATEAGNDIDATFYFTLDWDHPDVSTTDAELYVIDTQTLTDTDWYEVDWRVETRLDYSSAPAVSSDDAGTADRGDLDETFYLGGTLIYYESTDDNPASDQVDVWIAASEYGTNVGPWSDLTLTSGAFSVTCYADDVVGQDTYTVKPVIESAGSGGTSLYYTTDLTDTYIADRIKVLTTTADDTRVSINANSEIRVTLELEYDNEVIGSGDSVTLDDVAMSWDAVNTWWDLSRSQASVGIWKYFVNSSSEATHGITGLNLNSQEQDVIWDQIVVVSYTIVTPAGDDRVDTGTTVTIDVELHYDYDDTDVADGTVTVNSLSTVYQSLGKWRFTDSEATVMANTYNNVQCTGNTHGITEEDNTVTEQVIWDQIQVQSYSVSDARDNIGENVDIDVTLWYDYDDSLVTDGTVTINTISAAHQGSGVWRITENEATVQQKTYDTVACSGNANGITVVNQNGQSDTVIWDQIVVQTTVADDGRVDVDANSEIRVTLWLDYDNSYLGTGDSVTLDGVAMTWDSGNSWFDLSRTQASVNDWLYFVNSSSEATFGITALDVNSQQVSVIWDRIIILTTTTQDGRIDISTSADLRVTAQLEYDSHALGAADTLYMEDTQMSWVSTYFQLQPSQASVNDWLYFVNSSSANEVTYGITVVNLDSNNVAQIWDRIIILTTTTQDGRIDYNTQADIRVTAQLEYDSHALGSGDTLYMNDTSMSWVSTYFQLQPQFAIVDTWIFFVNSSSANEVTYGITVVNLDSNNVNQIWDRIIILTTTTQDGRINYNTQADIRVTAQLEYDSHALGASDTLYMNDTSMSWVSTYFQLQPQFAQIGLWNFYVNSSSASEATYGITVVNLDSKNVDQIWDRIIILTTTTEDGRIDVSTAADLRVTAQLEYDSHALGSGDTLYMNDTSMSWVSTYFQLQPNFAVVGTWIFFVNSSSANEVTYGITLVNLDSNNVNQIWDSLTITITDPSDQRNNINTNATGITVTAIYDYDSATFDGSLTLNDTTYQYATVGKRGYTVASASGDSYGITAISTNDETYCIWDRLVVDIQADDETPDNDVEVTFTLTVTFEYDSVTCTTYQIMFDRNATHWYSFTNANKSSFVDTNSDVNYNYTGESVTSESTYGITVLTSNTESVTWSAGVGNAVPVNNTGPTIQNADDTNNLYAKYKFYLITSNITDTDGFADIDQILLLLWDNGQSTNYWTLKYDEDTDTFSIVNGSAYITLKDSAYSKSGNWVNITWSIKIDWDHPDLTSIDMRQFCNDTAADSDVDWYESNWDTETRLDYTLSPTLTDDRGDVNTANLQASGTVIFYGSVDNYPFANETDIWIVHDVSGTWSGDVDGSGDYTITSIGSSASVRLNTYTFKIVVAGGGSGDTDLYYTTSITDTFITDRIKILTTVVDDSRVSINTNAEVRVTAELEYDNTPLGSGDSMTLDSVSMSWDGTNSWFDLSRSQSTVGLWAYFANSSSQASFGITALNLDSNSVSVIWDRVQVQSYTVSDARDNVNDDVLINATLYYDYDDAQVTDGTVTINGLSASYFQNGIWYVTDNKATVQQVTYNTVAASGNTHGITAVDQNGQSTSVIWDQIVVQTTVADDSRVNINDNVEIRVTLWLDYDDTYLGSGDSVSLDDQAMTWDSGNGWFDLGSRTQASVGLWKYFVNSTTEATYGITAFDLNSQEQDVIWDQIVVQTTVADDSRLNIDANSEIRVTLWLDYDDSYLGSGDSVTLNDTAMSWDAGNSWFELTRTQSSVGAWLYFVNSTSEATYGITTFDLNSQQISVVWDQVVVQTTTVDDSRVSTDTDAQVRVTLWLAYDSSFLGSGSTVTLNDTAMSWDGDNSWFELNISLSSVGQWVFFVNSTSDGTYGVTSLDVNSQQVSVIWDRVIVVTTTADDEHAEIGQNVEIRATLKLEYDNHYLGAGDTVQISATATSWDGGDSRFEMIVQQNSVGEWTYQVSSVSEVTYGITSFTLDSKSVAVVWDRVEVYILDVDDNLVVPNTQVNFTVQLRYEFDQSSVTTGSWTLKYNSVYLTLTLDGLWKTNDVSILEATRTYNLINGTDATFGITEVNMDSNYEVVEWSAEADEVTATDPERHRGSETPVIPIPIYLTTPVIVMGLIFMILAGVIVLDYTTEYEITPSPIRKQIRWLRDAIRSNLGPVYRMFAGFGGYVVGSVKGFGSAVKGWLTRRKKPKYKRTKVSKPRFRFIKTGIVRIGSAMKSGLFAIGSAFRKLFSTLITTIRSMRR